MTTQEIKKSLTAVDRSTKALLAAQVALSKAQEDANTSLASTANQLAQTVQDLEFKQSELTDLDNKIKNQEREMAADLRLRAKEDSVKVLQELLKADKLSAIPTTELQELRSDLESAQANQEAEIEVAVVNAQEKAAEAFEQKLKEAKSAHLVTIAQLEANSKADKQGIEMWKQQYNDMKVQLEANRQAEIQRAEASAKAQGITVNTSGK